MEPLRILFIEDGLGFGGSIISLSSLLRGLEELATDGTGPRIRSTVLTHLSRDITEGLFPHSEIVRVPSRLNYRTRDSFTRWIDDHPPLRRTRRFWMRVYSLVDGLHDQYLISRISRLAREKEIQLIHLNNGFQRPGLLAARRTGLECVVHLRGVVKRRPVRIDEQYGGWIWQTVRCCIGVSGLVSEGLRRIGVPEDRVRTIHNPVIPEEFSHNPVARAWVRKAMMIPPDSIVASVFGRVTPWKGQLEFVKGMLGVMGECPDLWIMIVGDESDAADRRYLEEVKEVARDPRIEGKVIFTGYQKDVADFFSATDIVVHSSTEPEPFGRVVPEGMACGCAVIGMDEGGPPEVITHGVDGWLVPPRDPSALGEAVRLLYDDAELRAALGEAGVKTARARFTPKHHARQVLACYPEWADDS